VPRAVLMDWTGPRWLPSAFLDFQRVSFRNFVVIQRLLQFLVLRHLPVDALPPSGPQGDLDPPSLFLEDDLRFRSRLEGDVPLAHGTTARELNAIEDASHRWLGLASDTGPEALVMSEPPLHH